MRQASATAHRPLTAWLHRQHGPVNGVVTFDRRHLYIPPTRSGAGFGVLLVAMLLTSLNYNISLGFALTFLLAGIGMACMWMAYRNLLEPAVSTGAASPAFVGDVAVFALNVDNADPAARIGLEARTPQLRNRHADHLMATAGAPCRSACRPSARGRTEAAARHVFQPLSVRPVPRGATRTCRWWPSSIRRPSRTPRRCRRWPARTTPRTARYPSRRTMASTSCAAIALGDPLHRIAWKHSARTGRMLSRTGTTPRQPGCWLDWDALPPGMDTEARLSRLCAWVLAAGDEFEIGLRLPGVALPPAQGAAHRRACLEALAVWPERRAS